MTRVLCVVLILAFVRQPELLIAFFCADGGGSRGAEG